MQLLDDVITGQPRLLAPGRAQRLGPRPEGCPFCPGNEEHTPPEIARIVDESGAWQARAVPNLFPLADVHEVLINSPRHVTCVRELSRGEWAVALDLWRERLLATARDGEYCHLFVNDGKAAGASLEHTHAQLVRVPDTAGSDALIARVRDARSCAACVLLADDTLHIVTANDVVLIASPTPRTGGSLLLIPTAHDASVDELNGGALVAACAALQEGPFNLWLVQGLGVHWYVELVPRTAIPAGVEMGLGIGVSIVGPHDTAAAARDRLAAALGV